MRRVEPEILDTLPADDCRAQRSRRDLRRINSWMGNARILGKRLQSELRGPPPATLTEIGAGDGTLMLALARGLHRHWPKAAVELVDRQSLLDAETAAQFVQVGWSSQALQSDVFDWARQRRISDVVVANLFLHHFHDAELRELFAAIASGARLLVACEPRRLRFPRWAGLLVGAIGCNSVTRHDAVVSVRAGFKGLELSALWPGGAGWRLQEGPAGLFSHCFVAARL
jgi:hypothetical protein